MDYNRIEILLNKYWECETSLDEEKELRTFFASHKDDKWAREAALFSYFEETRNSGKLGEFFDHRILDEISKAERNQGTGKVRTLWMNIGKIAAVILVLITAVVFSVKDFNGKKEEIASTLGTYEDPKKAFEETKKALLLISQSMNTGKKQAQKITIFNDAQQKIKKDLEPDFDNKEDK